MKHKCFNIQNTTTKSEEEYRFILLGLYLRAGLDAQKNNTSDRVSLDLSKLHGECEAYVAHREDVNRLFAGNIRCI